MKLQIWLGSAVLALVIPLAHSDCISAEVLKTYGEKHFKAIDDGGDTPGGSIHNSKFKLPKANSCFLYISSPRLSSFNCKWRVVQGIANKAEAVRTYEALVQAMLLCVRRPETLERFQRPSNQGERASMLDSFAGIRPTQQRAFEVSYGYSNYWWSVELEYEVNDEVEP